MIYKQFQGIVETTIDRRLGSVNTQLGKISTDVDRRLGSVNDQLGKINKDIKSLHRDTRKIKKDTEAIIDHFDKRDMRLQKE